MLSGAEVRIVPPSDRDNGRYSRGHPETLLCRGGAAAGAGRSREGYLPLSRAPTLPTRASRESLSLGSAA